MKKFLKDKLEVRVYPDRMQMGVAAARDVKHKMAELLQTRAEINMIFAAAPSQNEVLATLAADETIEWNRVNAYHMDEYIGLAAEAPQGFGNFLKDRLFDRVPFKSVHRIDPTATDPEREAARYAALLTAAPADIVVMGIGENGHIAFNDPPVADFRDPCAVKAVALDEVCRRQQVNDGCFARFEDVPRYALTLTVPTLVAAPWLFCIVPAKTKAKAVYETIYGAIDEHCPASILRTHDHAILYLDVDSGALL